MRGKQKRNQKQNNRKNNDEKWKTWTKHRRGIIWPRSFMFRVWFIRQSLSGVWIKELLYFAHENLEIASAMLGGTMRNQFLPSSCSDCLNMMTVLCPPRELWFQGRGTRYPVPRNDNFTSLGLFYSLSAWFRLCKGSLLETFWIIRLSLSNTHPRDQIRGTSVRIREGDWPQNK